jgi:hypothetical protein
MYRIYVNTERVQSFECAACVCIAIFMKSSRVRCVILVWKFMLLICCVNGGISLVTGHDRRESENNWRHLIIGVVRFFHCKKYFDKKNN